MGHNSVVSSYLKSTGIQRVDGLSTGPPDLGCHTGCRVTHGMTMWMPHGTLGDGHMA